MAIETTVVGSWPPPFGLRPKLRPYWRGEMGDAEADEVLAAAARIAMDEMLACELDEIMGGEVFAPDFVHHVPPRLAGLEVLARRDPAKGYDGIGRYRIVGELHAPNGTGHAAAFIRERTIEPRLHKAAVPSPWTITLPFPTDPGLDAAMAQLSDIVAAELRAMVAAGATEVQLDAPDETIAMVQGRRPVDELAHWIIAPLAEARQAGGPALRRSVHLCLGDISRRPAVPTQPLRPLVPLIEALDGAVERIHLELSYADQWNERDVLEALPPSMTLIAGIADVKAPPQPVDLLAARIEALAAIVGEDRLVVSSSCGCGRMPHDEAITLMRNLVKATRLVNGTAAGGGGGG